MPVLGLQGEVVHADDGTMSHFSFFEISVLYKNSESIFLFQLCSVFDFFLGVSYHR